MRTERWEDQTLSRRCVQKLQSDSIWLWGAGRVKDNHGNQTKNINVESKHHTFFIFCQNCIVFNLSERKIFHSIKSEFKKKKKQANIHLAIIDIV